MPRGQPTKYTKKLADEICAWIIQGKSLNSYTKQKNTPSHQSIYQWLREHKEFADNYARAREDQADTDADAINSIIERTLDGEIDPQTARVAIDGLKWTAGKRKPKKYGDKLDLNHSGDLDVSIKWGG